MTAARMITTLALTLALAGCWGSRETDEIAYVLAIGFDRGPGNNIIVTFQIANPKAIAGQAGGGGGGGAGGKPLITKTTVAALPIGAFNLANTLLSREISLLHTAAYVFSEDLARGGLLHFLVPLNRYRETRGTAFIYICRGNAREFMEKNQPELEVSPSKRYDLFPGVNDLHALTPVVQFREFYQNTKSLAGNPVAPLVGLNKEGLGAGNKPPSLGRLGDYLAGDLPSNKNQTQVIGTAVFRGDKMVGEITGDETRYLNMITGELDESFIIINDPVKSGEPLGMTLRQARKPVTRVRIDREDPLIEVNIYQEPEIVGLTSGINYESTELKPVLEKALAELIEGRCRDLVIRTQEEFRSDIFGFGRYARMNFLTREQWVKFRWEEIYPRADLDIKVHLKIRRTGLMLKTQSVHY